MQFRVLYNPQAGGIDENTLAETLRESMPDDSFKLHNMLKVEDYRDMLSSFGKDEAVMIAGGDGTLHRFINDVADIELTSEVWYFAAGNDNDFWTDIGRVRGDKPVCIDKYLKNLPTVTVGDNSYKFLCGVGLGMDGYCEEAAKQKRQEGKKVNRALIALKGLLLDFRPVCATVTVDGNTHILNKVWLASALLGRYGGGMKCAPEQNRMCASKTLTACLFCGKGRLGALANYPSVKKGDHTKKKAVQMFTGKEIAVSFDRPCTLLVDGETIPDVREYTVRFQ